MFTNKKLKTHKNRPVFGLNYRDADAASVTTNHRGVDVGSVYRNNTTYWLVDKNNAMCHSIALAKDSATAQATVGERIRSIT